MAKNFNSGISLFFIGTFLAAFYLFSYSGIGTILFILTAILSLISILEVKSKNNAKEPDLFSITKFIIPIPPIIALVLSSGFIYSPLPYFISLKYQNILLFAFLFIFLEVFIVFSIVTETISKIMLPLEKAGYDMDEVYEQMGKFSNNINTIAFLTFLISCGITFLLVYGPEISIGILPAIIIFLIVYVYVIFSYIKKGSAQESLQSLE